MKNLHDIGKRKGLTLTELLEKKNTYYDNYDSFIYTPTSATTVGAWQEPSKAYMTYTTVDCPVCFQRMIVLDNGKEPIVEHRQYTNGPDASVNHTVRYI